MSDKGYNDLEATIERLEFRNAKLHQHNEKIEKEIIELRKDNKSLAKQVEDQIKQFRNTGSL
jgi:predicted RNase H-like nuclease (RuvC/YqgF family)|tara:strand:- start:122 stop:307 length:186 start_codon:yes stop_codon:yes gene_type:complete